MLERLTAAPSLPATSQLTQHCKAYQTSTHPLITMTSSQQSGTPWRIFDSRLTLHIPSVAATDTSPEYEALDWTVNVGINHQFDSPDTALCVLSDGWGPSHSSGILDDDRWIVTRSRQTFLQRVFNLVTGKDAFSIVPVLGAELTSEQSDAAMSRFLKAYKLHSQQIAEDLQSKVTYVKKLFSTLQQHPASWPRLQRALRDRVTSGALQSSIECDFPRLSSLLKDAGIDSEFELKNDETYVRRSGAPEKPLPESESAEVDRLREQ